MDYQDSITRLRFVLDLASGTYTLSNSSVSISNNVWYHMAVIKVGNDMGLYLDGTQIAYVSVAGATNTNLGSMAFFNRNDGSATENVAGWMDDMAIFTSNKFSAAPNVGLSNTITVPTAPVGIAVAGNLTLESESVTASAVPATARIICEIDDADEVLTLNTDIKGWVSRDGGTTFTQATLTNYKTVSSGTYRRKLLSGSVSVAGQPSGTAMRYRITGHNSKTLVVKSGGMRWA
jgi:hypothetical protein